MKTRLSFPALVCALGAVFFCISALQAQTLPEPEGSELQFSSEPDNSAKIIKLSAWNFAWKTFIPPQDLEGLGFYLASAKAYPMDANKAWTQKFDRIGYGTYFTRVLVPEAWRNQSLALVLGPMNDAIRVYANGVLLESIGEPGTSRETTQASWHGSLIQIPDTLGHKAYINLVIHCANYSNPAPGFLSPPLLGIKKAVQKLWYRQEMAAYAIAGLCLVMGLYHLLLFFLHKRKRSYLWFSLVCIILALRSLSTDQIPLTVLTGNLSERTLYLFSYLSYTSLITFFCAFLQSLYKQKFRNFINTLNLVISGSYSLLCILSPSEIFTANLFYYQIYTLILGLFMTLMLVWALIKRKPNSFMYLLGFFIVFASMIHDILLYNSFVQGSSLVPYGISLFVFIEAFALARDFSLAVKAAEQARQELSTVNTAMSRFIPAEFLQALGRPSITEAQLNDFASRSMSLVVLDLREYFKGNPPENPKDTVLLINHLHSLSGPIIRKHGGFVYRYFNDSVLALFPESTDKALEASLELAQSLRESSYLWGQYYKKNTEASFSLGLHYGDVHLGILGEPKRMDSALISSAIKETRSLQSRGLNFKSALIISEAAYKNLQHPEEWSFRHMGSFSVAAAETALYECIDAEGPILQVQKLKNRRRFEYAVHLFLSAQAQEARACFLELAQEAPLDPGIQWYLALIPQKETPKL